MLSGELVKIFFDFDGTLIDVAPRHFRVYQECVKSFGGRSLDMNEYWRLKRCKTDWSEICSQSNISYSQKDLFLAEFRHKIELADYLKIDALFPGVEGLLERLSAQHECYLVSLRRKHNNLLQEIEWLGLTRRFKEIITGHSESDGSDIKVSLISKRLASNDSGIVCGDTEADILTGQQLGLLSVGVTSGIRGRVFLRSLKPAYLLSSVIELEAIPEIASY